MTDSVPEAGELPLAAALPSDAPAAPAVPAPTPSASGNAPSGPAAAATPLASGAAGPVPPAGGRAEAGSRGQRGAGRGDARNTARARSGAGPAASARPPHPVLQRLFGLYPKMFGARFLPLKLGVFQELMARHPEEFKKDDLKVALGVHARSTRYLESMAAGEKRHDLSGSPVEDVAPEHVHHAILEVFRRRQARSRDDVRPWLHERLVRAVEASGLSRQEYAQRFGSPDPQITEVLQAALAEVAERDARREALRRAYSASGRTPAEFADMYGIELAVVRRALAEPAVRLSTSTSTSTSVEPDNAGPEGPDPDCPVEGDRSGESVGPPPHREPALPHVTPEAMRDVPSPSEPRP